MALYIAALLAFAVAYVFYAAYTYRYWGRDAINQPAWFHRVWFGAFVTVCLGALWNLASLALHRHYWMASIGLLVAFLVIYYPLNLASAQREIERNAQQLFYVTLSALDAAGEKALAEQITSWSHRLPEREYRRFAYIVARATGRGEMFAQALLKTIYDRSHDGRAVHITDEEARLVVSSPRAV